MGKMLFFRKLIYFLEKVTQYSRDEPAICVCSYGWVKLFHVLNQLKDCIRFCCNINLISWHWNPICFISYDLWMKHGGRAKIWGEDISGTFLRSEVMCSNVWYKTVSNCKRVGRGCFYRVWESKKLAVAVFSIAVVPAAIPHAELKLESGIWNVFVSWYTYTGYA
jgi:hypothetical protein